MPHEYENIFFLMLNVTYYIQLDTDIYTHVRQLDLILPFTNYITHTCHHTFQTSLVGSSPFRERLGSNRLPEKPRPRFEHVYLDDFNIVALYLQSLERCSFAESLLRSFFFFFSGNRCLMIFYFISA